MPTIVAACHRLRHGDAPISPNNDLSFSANFYYMLFEKEPDPLMERLIDLILVLHADHSMNASTFSARVVSSTLADPYTVVSSAIGTLSGPLHGGANEKVIGMLAEIGDKKNARAYIERMIENKEKIMGIGHRVYKTKDPRAKILQKYAHKLFDHSGTTNLEILEIAEEVEKVVEEKLAAKGLYPNVDFYSGIVFQAMGMPTEIFTPIFAMARVSGWLAHWEEQLKTNRIYRPSQKYVGERGVSYVSLDER
jgi:citrate synthase